MTGNSSHAGQRKNLREELLKEGVDIVKIDNWLHLGVAAIIFLAMIFCRTWPDDGTLWPF